MHRRALGASALVITLIGLIALPGAAVDPRGQVTEFPVNVGPTNTLDAITAGPDGNLWFVQTGGPTVGRITTAGVATIFSAGITAGAMPFGIVAGPDGNLWFTEGGISRIARITT